MLSKGNLLRRLPTVSRMSIKTYSGVVGVRGVRFQLSRDEKDFSHSKVETHPSHPSHPLWSHSRNINVECYKDRIEYSIPIYSDQAQMGCHTFVLTILTKDTGSH